MGVRDIDVVALPRIVSTLHARPREPVSITTAPRGFEGEGFPVRRAFAGIDLRALDPFIMMDQMGEVEYAPGEPKGTPWHPHRGFETFTYLIDGQFLHQDSHGGGGIILEGGTQYMTAGNGILHIETPPEHLVVSGGLFHGVQLWIDLPKAKKRISPAYQDLQGEDVVMAASADGGSFLRILAGEVAGFQGPGISHTPLAIAHVTVAAGASVDIPWDKDFNAIAYVLSGWGSTGGNKAPITAGNTAVLGDGDVVRLSADHRQERGLLSMEVFLIGGKPLQQPVVQYGPFVMTTKAEILEALDDFQAGRFGQVPAGAIQPHSPQ
jgi:redox-sensitive bicupin YhaK (pirin superfamily)